MPQNTSGPMSSIASRRTLLKFFGAGAAALGTTSLLAACGGNASAGSSTGTGAMTELGISSAPGDVYLMDEISLKNKIYANHQLKVDKLVHPQSGVQAMQLLTAGGVNALQQDMLLTLAAFANGQAGTRPRIIGMRLPTTTYAIVTHKDFKGPSASATFEEKMNSLKGKTIGVPAIGAGADQQLRLALELSGLQPGSVTALAVGQFAPMISQMKANRVDAVVTQTWATSRLLAQATGGNIFIEFADAAVPDLLSGQEVGPLIMREDYVDKNPEVVMNFLAVQTEAKEWMVANKQQSADFLNTSSFDGKAADLSLAYLEHWSANIVPKMDSQWRMSRQSFDRMHEVAVRLGTLKAGQIKYEDIVADFARA